MNDPADSATTQDLVTLGNDLTRCPVCRVAYVAAGPAVCHTCALNGHCTFCAGEHPAQRCPVLHVAVWADQPLVIGANAGQSLSYQWHKSTESRARLVEALSLLPRAAWVPLAVAYAAYRGDTSPIAVLTTWTMACDGTARLPASARLVPIC